ncbi:MAG: hypothetical protein K8F62_03205 [Pseudorhodoplanes sp.]|nr:hypothetical protein [Pseudorhodoplanes sp.]
MITPNDGRNEETRRAALKELHGLRHEGAELGGAMSAMARRTASHFAGHDGVTERDPIELWGKRIGRGLSLVGFVALAIYLYVTYVK